MPKTGLSRSSSLTGGQIVAHMLREFGVNSIFSVSGNQILPIFDAAADFGIRIVHMRHESAAAYAAAASAEMQNKPGVVLVSAGPGFLAAMTGIATAKSMELPLLFLSGAPPTASAGNGGFQDLDQCAIAAATCKSTMRVSRAEEIGEAISSAWETAQSTVPGPVHIGLPADVLMAVSQENPAPRNRAPISEAIVRDEAILRAMADRLMLAERPLVIARPCSNRGVAGKALLALTRQLGIGPVVTECPRGLSDPKYVEVIRRYGDSDCALVISPADFAVGFLAQPSIASRGSVLLIDAPGDPRPTRLPDLHTQISPDVALPYLAKATAGHKPRADEWPGLWSFSRPDRAQSTPAKGLHPLEVAECVRESIQPGDVLVLDGGEFCQWIRLGLRDLPNRMLWNSKLGGIGGSIPLALGVAATAHSGRTIAFIGDGAFGYHSSEFETAERYALPFVAIVGNDARWAAEWHMQASRYGPERTFETSLLPVRCDRVAIGFGAAGSHVANAASLRSALSAALADRRPTCLNVRIRSVRSDAVPA